MTKFGGKIERKRTDPALPAHPYVAWIHVHKLLQMFYLLQFLKHYLT